MNALAVRLAVLLSATTGVLSQSGPVPESLSSLEPKQAGQVLAERLRSLAPAEDAEFKGVLKIKLGQTRIVPFTLKIQVENSTWKATYESHPNADAPGQKLVIVHAAGRPNEYFYAKGAKPLTKPGEPVPVKRSEAAIPLAGSDFWLTDLGLEFLHWPQQRLLKTEMRSSRVCHVLESINPQTTPGEYGRVVSWVDKESGGVIIAEAYDSQKKLLKEFSVGSFKKVEGQWQLQEMEIRNVQTRSRTRLEFDFDRAK